MDAELSDDDMENQITVEADQYIPYPLDEVAIDFEVQGLSERNTDQVEVLLAACRKENVEMREAALDLGQVKPAVVDIEAHGMKRAFELIKPQLGSNADDLVVAIIDIGATMTSLNVVENNQLIYTREQSFGGKQLTEEIMRRYDMAPEQANFFLRGEPGPENFEDEVLEPFMLNVVHQISRALQFYSSSAEFSNIRTIYLSGTMAGIKGLAEVVEQELGIKTSVANPIEGLDLAPSVAVQALNRNAPNLMVAMGLAMRGFD